MHKQQELCCSLYFHEKIQHIHFHFYSILNLSLLDPAAEFIFFPWTNEAPGYQRIIVSGT